MFTPTKWAQMSEGVNKMCLLYIDMNQEHIFNLEGFRELLKEYKLSRWKLTRDQVLAWSRLDKVCPREITFDCGVNVASFLKLLDKKTAKRIARERNVLQEGIGSEVISSLIYEDAIRHERLKTHHTFFSFEFDNSILDLIAKNLGPGHATILALQRAPKPPALHGIGHFVILAVDPVTGKPGILDPQQEKYCSYEAMPLLISPGQFTHFSLYLRLKREKRLKNETTKRVRRSSPEEHTRKKRRIGSPLPQLPGREPSESVERSDSEPIRPASFLGTVQKKKSTQKRGKPPKRSQTRSKSTSATRSASASMPVRRPSPIQEEGEISEREASLSYQQDGSPAFQPDIRYSQSRSLSGPEYNPFAEPEPEPEPAPAPEPVSRPATRASRRKR
jgi:hypothetical protein